MNELKKMKYGGYEEILEEKMEEIDKQTKVIQWYEKENRHNQEIIIKQEKEIEELKSDLLYVLEQLDGYLDKGWTIDLNFTDIREKYKEDIKEYENWK